MPCPIDEPALGKPVFSTCGHARATVARDAAKAAQAVSQNSRNLSAEEIVHDRAD
jgi:hypothetical protein